MDENLCPECGSKMISKLNKSTQQRFWGCSNFPKCRGTRDTDGRSSEERYQDRYGKSPDKTNPFMNRHKRMGFDDRE